MAPKESSQDGLSRPRTFVGVKTQAFLGRNRWVVCGKGWCLKWKSVGIGVSCVVKGQHRRPPGAAVSMKCVRLTGGAADWSSGGVNTTTKSR